MLPTNTHSLVRSEAQERYSARRALDVEGRWRHVKSSARHPSRATVQRSFMPMEKASEKGDSSESP